MKSSKKIIYTVGYTLFKQGNVLDLEKMFGTLKEYEIEFLIDVRSVPYSKQYPQCNTDNMKSVCKEYGIRYIHMPELGAKASSQQNVFSRASEIFYEQSVFPMAKSYRPEKTELLACEEIVDFRKYRQDGKFLSGLNRIEDAYTKGYQLCLMCSEKNPIDCHRYFLISKAIEQRFGEWLEIRHIVAEKNGEICYISNTQLNKELEKFCEEKNILPTLFREEILVNYCGNTEQEKLNDLCDRYWNLLHGWKRFNYNNTDNND